MCSERSSSHRQYVVHTWLQANHYQSCSVISLHINHTQATAEWLHDCSFNQGVTNFLPDPLMFINLLSLLLTTFYWAQNRSVRVIVAFICRSAATCENKVRQYSPFLQISLHLLTMTPMKIHSTFSVVFMLDFKLMFPTGKLDIYIRRVYLSTSSSSLIV